MMTRSMPPSPYYPNPICVLGNNGGWTQQQNKEFENALAMVDINAPGGWAKVAAMTRRSVNDVMLRYQVLEVDVNKIEAGDFPFGGYRPSSFTLVEDGDGIRQTYGVGVKRAGGRIADQERKKGVPWTEDEHRLFLLGLKKYGKGDWRNISRNFVYTRTPTQVASHAQKYFIRLNSGGKDKRRASIHDITTMNLPENNPSSPSQSNSGKANGRSDQVSSNEAASMFSPPYSSYGVKFENQFI